MQVILQQFWVLSHNVNFASVLISDNSDYTVFDSMSFGRSRFPNLSMLGERARAKLRELAPISRGNQEEGFTQPRAHSFAQPGSLSVSKTDIGIVGRLMRLMNE